MNWVKKNPAQFALAVVSVGLLGSAYMIYANTSSFPEKFEASRTAPTPSKEIPAVDTSVVDDGLKGISTPQTWTAGKGRLFAPKLYVNKDGALKRPDVGDIPFNPPISNQWLLKYNLDLLNPAVVEEDTDRDGFSTRLEWDGMDGVSHMTDTVPPAGAYAKVSGAGGNPLPEDQTDPLNAESHPPYHTRLALKDVVNIPFRLRFMTYDVNPRKADDITVSINTLDRGGRTLFLQLNQDIPQTKFKTVSFEKKEAPGLDGTKKDVSELTIINKESGEKLILPLNKVVDSPESYAVISYRWIKPGEQGTPDMNKQKGHTFNIPPENDKVYKVVDIRPDEVDIQLPSNQKLTLRKGK